MSDWKERLDQNSISAIEQLVWLYENCNVLEGKVIRDSIDVGIKHIKKCAKENTELIEKIDRLESENARLKAERDAAVADLKRIGECALCRKNGEQPACEDREGHERCFEWRGGE